jgi:hypothetical protein
VGKGKRARRKRENCAKTGKKHSRQRKFTVGMIETKNLPSKIILELEIHFPTNEKRERLTE